MARTRTLSPVQKAGWTLAGTGALAGLGTVYFMNETAESETAQISDTRKAMGLPWPAHVKERVNSTWRYVGAGLGISALAAAGALRTGLAFRMASLGALPSIGFSVVCCMVPMAGAMMLDPVQNFGAKNACWALSTAMMGVSLSPVGFLGQHIIVKAAMGTVAVVGSLSLAAMTAPSESMLWMSGPLSIGLGVVFAASVGSMFFPASPLLHTVAMYGGLGVFGGFCLYDTQKMIYKAEHMQVYDPVAESFSLYLDTINIFIRLAYIFAGNKKK